MSATRGRKKIGSFEVAEELAQGGMGIVYLAEQPSLERRVVLKTLRRDMASDQKLVERFRREARAPAAVHHQNVVAVYDCFEWRNEIYIAQEYVEGADLASVIQALQRLDPRVAAMIALEVTRGLEEIHESGIVHRDLKPANILVSASGETKVADFGIALDTRGEALTRVGHAVGTPLYMSPEQLLGEKAEPRSDLYSLGVVLYEMVTGRTPFLDGDSEAGEALVRQIEAGRYPRLRKLVPEAPTALARVVRTCLQPKPRKRFSWASELRRALERQLGTPSPSECRRVIAEYLWERNIFRSDTHTVLVPRRAPSPRRGRTSLGWMAAAVAAVILGAGAVAAVATGRVDPKQIQLPETWPAFSLGREEGLDPEAP